MTGRFKLVSGKPHVTPFLIGRNLEGTEEASQSGRTHQNRQAPSTLKRKAPKSSDIPPSPLPPPSPLSLSLSLSLKRRASKKVRSSPHLLLGHLPNSLTILGLPFSSSQLQISDSTLSAKEGER